MATSTPDSAVRTDWKYTTLGDSQLVVSQVCLGTMTFGKQNSEQEAHQLLDYAVDQGINFIDTAELYPVPVEAETQGRTEVFIGNWLKKRARDKLVVASKICGAGRDIRHIRGGPRVDKRNVMEGIEGILRRLQTDYIDLLQIHWPDRYVPLFGQCRYDWKQERPCVPIEEQLYYLQMLITQGKVRYIGLSNETAWGVTEFVRCARQHGLAKVISIQNSYSLLHREFECALAEVCSPSHTNVPLLAYSPLAGGVLTGKYCGGQIPKASRFSLFPQYMKRFHSSLALEAVEQYYQVAKKYGMTLTQLALGWCKHQPFIASTIIGATNRKQLEENIQVFCKDWITEEIEEEINQIYMRWKDPSLYP
ncbi:aldo/keto reductase isoform 1 [Galdieria sulphuraria]|uniref:Aldo/keto reductase isoform 1 n=1 Tax=Galdieria sulphuraria TaxID=130081 RepID=M2XXR9_GALSU|nr:aldo/keto reductase isoform 1 [Galdieria sulphuraria]EME28408.1 aldo/keto reductase isoform 1 [Galdieria sulphuraria]|eukprot:XP_005704928.1 aldo/keto reductase isoform 1 [Galdieria sulphuraria]